MSAAGSRVGQRPASRPAAGTAGTADKVATGPATPVRYQPVAAGPLSDSAAKEVASRLRVLGCPVRVKLMSILFGSAAGQECGRVLAAAVGLPETTVSRHLSQLRAAGLIESQRRGMHVFHRPNLAALTALCTALDPGIVSPRTVAAAAEGIASGTSDPALTSLEGHAARTDRTGSAVIRRATRPRFRSA